MRRRFGPVAVVLLVVLVGWYVGAFLLNLPNARDLADDGATSRDEWISTMWLDRPMLPAPHQVVGEIAATVFGQPVGSPRSLVTHAAVTAGAASAGFALAVCVGLVAAIGIVHVRALDRSLMPWIVASQTIPVLALAPMVVIVLGNVGVTGLVPKALIAGYLSFLPVTIAMVAGLRAAEPMQLDLLRTYSAGRATVLRKLRWPMAMNFLFPGLKVAAALSLTGAIVAELPTGAQAGLGARLLAGSYYGQTLQIWAALVAAACLAWLATAAVGLVEAAVLRGRGGRP